MADVEMDHQRVVADLIEHPDRPAPVRAARSRHAVRSRPGPRDCGIGRQHAEPVGDLLPVRQPVGWTPTAGGGDDHLLAGKLEFAGEIEIGAEFGHFACRGRSGSGAMNWTLPERPLKARSWSS